MKIYSDSDLDFVSKFLLSRYIDDVVSGATDVESAYPYYLKSKLRLAEAGFKLRKFVTNSDDVRHVIRINDSTSSNGNAGEDIQLSDIDGRVKVPAHTEEDQSYAKSSLGVKADEKPGTYKVLGVQWNVNEDEFCFGIGEVDQTMEDLEPTE